MLRGLVKGQTDLQGCFRLIPYHGEIFSVGVIDSHDRFLRLLQWKSAEEVLNRKLKIIMPEGATVRTAAEEGAKSGSASATRAEGARPQSGITLMGRAVGPKGQPVTKGVVLSAAFLPLSDWGSELPPIRDGWFTVPGLRPGTRYELYEGVLELINRKPLFSMMF